MEAKYGYQEHVQMDDGGISVIDNEGPTVAVLMSTYNGEKYIREQLDSILSQEGVNIKLCIRDDGSSDETVKIIEEYAHNHPCISYYCGENIGVGKSFMELLKNAPDADYYSFADQDDVWLKDKLSHAVEVIEEVERGRAEFLNRGGRL